ncbi:MAG TPA: hypothetical protein PLN33_05125 [Hyphomonadaceae bacterium]|jgi:hypothetical protein|nr:hypothetical protein [Hyphomonadaceae bacterium]HPN04738.1 hypothetical protein [Hyphomonadaceae bacterium]
MAYEIHITRDGADIVLSEWVAAVGEAEHVRLAEGDYLVTLPETGQVFRFANTGGDTEVHFAGVWRRVFRWHEGRVSFVGPKDFHIEDSHMRCVVRALAAALRAQVVGDEGRTFD